MFVSKLARLLHLFPTEIALDVGTANTRIHVRGTGVVLNEASVICIRQPDPLVAGARPTQSVGNEARSMLGRLPRHIEAICPIKGGVISDFSASRQMIQHFVGRADKGRRLSGAPRITITVPSGATQVERRAFREAVQGAGASNVALFERPLAAALGAGLTVAAAMGCMVVDVGAGTTDIGVIALGNVVCWSSARVGGNAFDDAIINYVRRKHGLLIGEHTAQRVKQMIGCAVPRKNELYIDITGRNLSEGVPRTLTLSSHEVFEALADPLAHIVSLLKSTLESMPPELASDIAGAGLMLTGGGALLDGLDDRLHEETGLPVVVAEEPMTCVVRGAAMAIETLEAHFFQ
ncbi:rod shape-determining protein MreB [Caballeronia udeis]|uniref:Cell shape-determining protein MreB n=1 Tax=Caballeronia udeis TaxID=1232866 RepID=A0A158JUE2_9BURK|nr:rod shape-determining protein MreB [Caballeronia udeis]